MPLAASKTPSEDMQWRKDTGKHDTIMNRRFKVIKVKESSIPVDALYNSAVDGVRESDRKKFFQPRAMAFKLTKYPKEMFYDKYESPGLDSTSLLLPNLPNSLKDSPS
jgi:hypothetical protein